MIEGDYSRTIELMYRGKKTPFMVVRSVTGEEYGIGKQLGRFSFGETCLAVRLKDNKELIFREFFPSDTFPVKMHLHEFRTMLGKLVADPVTEEDGKTRLQTFIQPIGREGVIDLPASKGFGYIMEKVDTKQFLCIGQFRSSFPDADVICDACIAIASTFRRIHISKGMCVKYIDDSIFYIDPKTGDVRLICLDDLTMPGKRVYSGTRGYMAPEQYVEHTSDFYTNYFSMAVAFYRILVGGFPYDGKKAAAFLEKNNASIDEVEVESIVYGRDALFAFDPKDQSNTIIGLVDPAQPNLYKAQAMLWHDLPEELQNCFIKAFSTGRDMVDRHLRPTDRDWVMTFRDVKKRKLVKCPGCGRISFGSEKPGKKCVKCSGILPSIQIC